MKKLLTILTTSSAVFLITAGVMLANKNSVENNIYISKQIQRKPHKIEGDKLIEIGYYWDSRDRQVRIERIPPNVKVIAAQLPPIITSLKGAFQTRTDDVIWHVPWDTKKITNMNSMFYNNTWFNSSSILEWDTSNVTDMGEMFGLTGSFNQDLSKWNVSKVKNFKKMFYEAKSYNNDNKPLKWNDKLKSAVNMEGMFQGASSFEHSLSDWKLETEVNNKNFGLSEDRHPKWKEKLVKPSTPINLPNSSSSNNIDERSDNNQINRNSSTPINSNTISTNPNNDLSSNTTNGNMSEPSISNNMLETPISSEDKPKTSKNNENTNYIIPPYKPNTLIKSNSPNAGLIAGSILGSFTILGTTAGLGYYYRKNLKNLYLKSADKIKPSLLKSKDNIKDFYVKSIDKTKNLYFKSKNKIKDKLAKIKSKK
ncbi:BspA family leucine-rich repeat surface protein [Mycoplasma capricolum subsp. capricolum]|uniref:BspA family leucine-rich repeat surface protein n=1 Tax=Mycoplasma capricolum TaxID=2095 RepID=UPI003DA67C42